MPAPSVQKGDILDGKYRVEKLLGFGGMGVVVAARHIELDTYVALKFMLPEALDDAESVQRFSREARAMVKLKNVHSARVFDVGKLHNGAPYMVMELLVGHDLGELLEKTGVPLPIADAVDYVLQACEGIAEAHALGIVHRDIKPRNIFLTRDPEGKVLVKVLDFGLAKSIKTVDEAERALTQTTAVMGSPAYMSPEQMRASRNVDARSDVWSLGVCLYELLTHAPPFDAQTMPELCALVLTAAPRPPIAARPDMPAGLSDVIMRCLEKEPKNRFGSVRELVHALAPHAGYTTEAALRLRGERAFSAPLGVPIGVPIGVPSVTAAMLPSRGAVGGPRRGSGVVALVVVAVVVAIAAMGAVVALRHRAGAGAGAGAEAEAGAEGMSVGVEPLPPAVALPAEPAPPATGQSGGAATASASGARAHAPVVAKTSAKPPAAPATTTTAASSAAAPAHPPPVTTAF